MNNVMSDKDILTDSISSQKFISSNYNNYAGECSRTDLRDAFLCILDEEHEIQSQLFTQMNSKGWYPVQAADKQKIEVAKQKFPQTF